MSQSAGRCYEGRPLASLYSQPAILTHSVVVWQILCRELGYRSAADVYSAVMGHSLGEITALCVAGAVSLKDAVKLAVSQCNRHHATSAYTVREWSAEQGCILCLVVNRQYLRGSWMLSGAQPGDLGMAVLTPCSLSFVKQLCDRAQTGTAQYGLVCAVSCINSATEVVMVGHVGAVHEQ